MVQGGNKRFNLLSVLVYCVLIPSITQSQSLFQSGTQSEIPVLHDSMAA